MKLIKTSGFLLLIGFILISGCTQTNNDITRTYMAEKNESITIHPEKYPGTSFTITILNIETLQKRGNAYAKGGNDNILVTLRFNNHTIWDINDTQGTNISIYDNGINDLVFKSEYLVGEDAVVFSMTEIDVPSKKKI